MRLNAALPRLSWATIAPFVAAAPLVLAAMLDAAWIPFAGGLFAFTLVIPPLTIRPTMAHLTRLGPDGPVTRLASSSTRATAALWIVIGSTATYLVLSDVNPTTPGVVVAILVAGGIVVASAARRLTGVSLLAVSTVQQVYPRRMAWALALIRIGIAIGVMALVVWEHFQAIAWALSATTCLLFAVAGVRAFGAVRHQARWRQRNVDALKAVRPDFAIHISGPSGSAYQVNMWLPLLERAQRPFIIIVREADLYHEVARGTSVPVVFAPNLADLDQLAALRFGTVFYVNNGVKNGHLVRRVSLHHVQLLHGESDKVSSRNPVAAMFDALFVAGQAAVDRYWTHNIAIPADRFHIVGRPQVEGIEAPRALANGVAPTVLYAPTWNGFFDDADYSSLVIGLPLVQALVDEGARVIFRPHPYSYKSPSLRDAVARIESLLASHAAATGIDHVFGARATTDASTTDCFNWSDAMVSDVSSVPIDYLFSEKPLAVVEMHQGSLDRTPGKDTLAVGAIVVTPVDDLRKLARALVAHDSHADARARARRYYLADFPREGYADTFIRAVTETVDAHLLPDVEGELDDLDAVAEAVAEPDGEPPA